MIRVAIVEDDRATREGLAQLVSGTPGFECIAAAPSVEDLLPLLSRPPGVLLLDIQLPGISGPDAIPLLREKYPAMQIVMLTVFDDADRVFRSICNGACGYLLKKTAPARLLDCIREAHEGGAPMTPEIARKVITLFRQAAQPQPAPGSTLSPREVQVLTLLADGYGYINIAAQLQISVNTVRNHVRSIYEKLHVHSASEAVSKALRTGLI